jgi:hypothetical protein
VQQNDVLELVDRSIHSRVAAFRDLVEEVRAQPLKRRVRT